jgi:hypothetical protein
MTISGRVRVLHHGTTRQRAEAIIRDGPDPNYVEPAGPKAEGFSTAPAEGPFWVGSPTRYAIWKAALFPEEGGPVLVEVEVPVEIIDMTGGDLGGDIRFEPGFGLEELREVWPSLAKRIIPVVPGPDSEADGE